MNGDESQWQSRVGWADRVSQMIVVKVNCWSAITGEKTELCRRMHIANDCTSEKATQGELHRGDFHRAGTPAALDRGHWCPHTGKLDEMASPIQARLVAW